MKKNKLILLIGLLFSSLVLAAGASRVIQGDSWVNAAKTKTWNPPSVSGTLSCVACTEVPTNKTISGATNTFTNIPNSATTAVSTNTASTIVTRDGSGNFAAGTITAALTGNVTGNLTGNVTGNVTGAVTGNASTATALAADPADCSATQYATSINASGTLGCAQPNFTDLAGSATNAQIGSGYTQPYEMTNMGYKISVSAGAMTISLTQADGSTACSSGASACKINFHGTSQGVGSNSQISITAATTLTLGATDSLGTNGTTTDSNVYLYLVNDTTPELCASGSYWDDGIQPISPSALTGGADTTITTIWCTSAHTNKSFKYIGYINATWSNPNWTTSGASLAPGRFPVMAAGGIFGSTGLTGIGINIYPSAANQVPRASGAGPTSAWTWQPDLRSNDLVNVGIATSVGSSALTVALKQADGSTNCSAALPCNIAMRSSTAATGGYNLRSVTGALSVVVSSGSTLGWASAAATYGYVYAIDNAGTVELAVSSAYFDCGSVVSTTAEGGAGAADSNAVMYSTTARTNVACRIIGRFKATEATAGTWATTPSETSLIPSDVIFPRAVFQTSAGQSIANTNTDTIVNFGTIIFDNCNCVTTGASWKFTVPATGKYVVASSILYDALAWVVGNDAGLAVYQNGSKAANLLFNGAIPTGTDYVGLSGSVLYAFAAGDTIDLRTKHNRTAGAATLETTQSSNTVSIYWVGP